MDHTTQPAEAGVPAPRLLVVDDEPDNLELLVRLFQRHGCVVYPATNGTEALRLAAQLKPDLVLLDVMMPDVNGREVCRAIKASPALVDVFVALISSVEISADSTVEGLQCGADEYITRPIGNKELVARVNALIRIQRALTARRVAEAGLALLNQTLEQRVAERTAELGSANERLRCEVVERHQAQARSEAFARLGERLSATGTPRAAAEVILETARQLLGWDACFLQLYSPATARLTPVLAYDTRDGAQVEATASFRESRPAPRMRRVMEQGGRLLDGKRGGRATAAFHDFGGGCRPAASLLYVPIRHGGAVAGLLSVQSYSAGHYTEDSLQTLQALADHCGGALERLSAEAGRHASDERFAAFMEHSPAFAWIKDERFRYVYVNPRACRFLKRAPAEIVGRTDRQLFPRAVAAGLRAHDEAVLERGATGDAMENISGEGREPRYCWTLRFPLRDAAGRRYVAGMGVDITEKVRAEEALRALPHRILAAQENERRRVARELHDGVSQLLASVRFRLLAVEGWLHDRADDTLRREVTRAKSHLDGALREVRHISHNLRPRELDDLGLVAAIRGATVELQARSALRVTCRLGQFRTRLPPDLELALYRIFQEAVANVLKHSGAKQMEVELLRDAKGVTLRVTDDGCGFVPARKPKGRSAASLGLVNMRERAEFIGGICTVKAAPREGTVVEAWAPLQNKRTKSAKP